MPDRIYFLEYEIRPAIRQLLLNGNAVSLGSRAYDLLTYLIEHRHRVVPRDELMQQVWHGLTVGENNLNVQVSILRKLLGSRAIVTLPGRGLQFGIEVTHNHASKNNTGLALPSKPSVVILPFMDWGVDPDLNWLPDSLVEDLTTELSRFRHLFVVSRNSAFTYKDQRIDVSKISNQLGVRYVVEGSVRTAPGRVRVTAQLIDAQLDHHVWAENFDSPIDHHFELQEEIVRAIATALAPQIDAAENAKVRSIQPTNLNAHGLAQKAWTAISEGEMKYDPTLRNDALAIAESALAIDANSGLAWRAVAWIHWWHAYHGTTESRRDTLNAGIAAASKAMAIDANDHHAWRINALLHFMDRNPDQGLAGLRHAHSINPNCATTLAWLGLYEAMHGDVPKGVPYAKAALRLSPKDPSRGSILAALGFAQFASGDYLSAAQSAEAARLGAPDNATPLLLGAISWVGTGHIEKAKDVFVQLNMLAPALVEARLAGTWLSTNKSYQERALKFLQVAAGMADPSEAKTLLPDTTNL